MVQVFQEDIEETKKYCPARRIGGGPRATTIEREGGDLVRERLHVRGGNFSKGLGSSGVGTEREKRVGRVSTTDDSHHEINGHLFDGLSPRKKFQSKTCTGDQVAQRQRPDWKVESG